MSPVFTTSAASVLAILLLVASPAAAEPSEEGASPEAAESANAAYEEAMAAYRDGRFTAAAEGFEAAYEHVSDAALLWNIGRSWEKAGELERARDRYKSFLAHDDVDGELRDKVGDALLRVGAKIQARKDAETHEERIAQLRDEIAEAEREKNAELIDKLEAQVAEERAAKEDEADEEEPPSAAGSTSGGSSGPGGVQDTYEPETTPPSAWSWVTLGAGLAAAAGGAYLLVDAGNTRDDVRSAKSDAAAGGTDMTLSRARTLESDANRRARAGAATVAIGSALAVTGVILAATTGGDPADPAVSFAATPTPDGGILAGAFRF